MIGLFAALVFPTAAEEPGIPYGFWGLNGHWEAEQLATLREEKGMTVFQTASTDRAWTVETLLPAARAAGVSVTLRLTGDHPCYTHDGDFDVHAWKAMLAPWAGAGLQPFIDDGTLAGHMLLDDIHNFPGEDPTAAELDEMARYSKRLLPGLMTYVRERATRMPEPERGTYVHVDACVNQYRVQHGGIEAYAREESARAAELGLRVIHGLNIADGGDGSSGQPGWGEGRWAMSAEEIRRYGAVLLEDPSCGMFLNWEYDALELWSDGSLGAAYFDQPEVEAALSELGGLAAEHPSVPLLKRRRPRGPVEAVPDPHPVCDQALRAGDLPGRSEP